MRTQFKTTLLAAALCLGATMASAASLALPTDDPTILAEDTTVSFALGDIFSFSPVTGDSGGVGAPAFLDFSANDQSGGFSVTDGAFGEIAGSGTLLATGFTDTTIELRFGDLTGSFASQFGSTALLVVTFADALGPRASIFDGLVDGETYAADLSLSAVVPLPASAVLLGTALLGIGLMRRRRHARHGGSIWTND